MATTIATMSHYGTLGRASLTIRAVVLAAASLTMLGLAAAPALTGNAQGTRSGSPAELQEVFLVASGEAATDLTRLLDEANLVRAAWGEGPVHFEVTTVGTSAEAVQYAEDHEHANEVRAAYGLPPIALIELR